MWQTLIKSFNTAEILLPGILIKLEEIIGPIGTNLSLLNKKLVVAQQNEYKSC
jgi:hypothetical protein